MTVQTTSNLEIHKVERIRDKASEKYFEVITFPTSKSTRGRLQLLPSVINDRKAFEKTLRDAGAILPKVDADLVRILTTVAKSDAPKDSVYEAKTGWMKNFKAFVTTDRLIGKASTNIIGVNCANNESDQSGQLSSKGTWEAWRDTVAMPASQSTILMFSICVALAAPLLAVTKRQSFTFCIFGETRSGKSVATLCASSVLGIGRIEDLITWNIKEARLQQRLPEYNDAIFPIDDLNAMKEDDRAKYLRIRHIAYLLTQGLEIRRHSSFQNAHGGSGQWRCIALTSCETAVRDLAKNVKLARQKGEASRLIDVPAVFDALGHIFDRLPTTFDASDFPLWKNETFKHLAEACEKNHGYAFKKYIESLIARRSKLRKYIQERIDFFIKKNCDKLADNIAYDFIEKFALVYAGGMLGIRCGLLPWNKKDLLAAISKCFVASRRAASR